MMRDVVDDGTGTEAEVAGYTVAGKTGTAAKPERDGGYSDTAYVASFVGIVPAKEPRLAILVAVDEPQGDIYGGTVAAPAFAQIAEFALQYLDVPPDEPPSSPDARRVIGGHPRPPPAMSVSTIGARVVCETSKRLSK